ncbi:response regulator [Aeoliella mucimassa]|uniref:Alkaline phosphatase synthesis transcriptional regulatory protein PhoP n=1 Tax=Aeoliella mucimassa TaxID=2527972 RepID=A0A518AJ64_9BACT|nr:response regulator [Aeoliella mucimassa]QDU54777.1 Alkaline phosphatase synthesis transcriptional regulatory protein PhoP [Aeoliella mucimassa]
MENTASKVLIAEDNAALLRVLEFTLARAGYAVTQASDGAQAWQHAQAEDFDIVLTDQQMPYMTGVELCTNLRSLDRYEHTPIVLLTAKGMELELPQLCAELGIAATFSKPFSPSQVLKKVQELLAAKATV